MKIWRDKHRLFIKNGKTDDGISRGVKIEWGKLGWFGFAYRQDPNGFTLNFFAYWNLHISFASGRYNPDGEVKTYGGMIVPQEKIITWQWAWTGGGSEVSKPGTFKQFAYGDILLGEPVFSERRIGVFEKKLEMPEAAYGLEITLDEGSWKRPRSPFTRRQYRARILVADDREIPVPLSETEDSGTYGETRNGLKTRNIEKILKAYKHDLLEERRFVGGSYDWRPKNLTK